jgi:predicted phage terminase large subunit-like protein
VVSSALAIETELAVKRFADFVRHGWHVVEPTTPLVWSWHLDIECDALERQIHGEPEYRKLLFCVPPGTMKSLLISVFAPAWEWLERPERRKLCLSNDDDVATRDSRKMREVIKSEWYQGLVAYVARTRGLEAWTLSKDQAEKVNFENTRRGFRQSRSMNSKITGKRGDDIIIDDPLDANEVVNGSIEQVAGRLRHVNNVIEKVVPSRVNNLAEARWTLIMQRLHQDDPAGRAMAEGGWKVINLQMEYEPGNPLNHPRDKRKEEGQLLFPELFPREELEKLKVKLGNEYSGQYQQNPLPRAGGPLKPWYWRFWYPQDARPPQPVVVRKPDGSYHECHQAPLPDGLTLHTQSWDCAFKDTKDSAFVVGQLWAQLNADSFLLDQLRDKMDIVATVDAVRLLSKRWPQALNKLIEDKANGPAVIRMLRAELPGLNEVDPKGGKEARANGCAPVCRSGNVWLPHPALFAWVHELLAELEAFPAGSYTDQVDALTQYLNHRYGTGDQARKTRALGEM